MKAWDKAVTGNGPIAKIWGEWGSYISLGLIAFLAWKLWPLFSGVGGVGSAVGEGLAGLTANMSENGKRAQQRAALRHLLPNPTDAQLAQLEADANAFATALGAKSTVFVNAFNTNWPGAYALAKKYSRVVYTVLKDGKIKVNGLRHDHLALPVLYPLYSMITDGRSLLSDLDLVSRLGSTKEQEFYRTYLRP